MDHPTTDQENILRSKARTILIDAIAGAGKTTTLAMLVRQMQVQGVNPRGILCLVFSQGAKTRIAEKLLEYGIRNAALIFTVDELARYYVEKLSESKVIRRPEQLQLPLDIRQQFVNAADRLWEKLDEQGKASDFNYDFGLNGHFTRLSQIVEVDRRLKGSLLSHYASAAIDQDEEDWRNDTAKKMKVAPAVIEICREYERARQRIPDERLWQVEGDHVSDLVQYFDEGLSDNHLYRYHTVLVDEWHDVNAAEFELIRRIRQDARLIVVGDRDQVINESRGAEIRFSTDKFGITYPDYALMRLGVSHRCGPSVCRLASGLATRPCEAKPGAHSTIHRLYYDPEQPYSAAQAVAAHVKKRHEAEAGTKHSDIVLLFRDEHDSIEFENQFLEAGIPYVTDGFDSYFLRPETLLLRALMHLVANDYSTLEGDTTIGGRFVEAFVLFVPMSTKPEYWDLTAHASQTGTSDIFQQAKAMLSKYPTQALEHFFTGIVSRVVPEDSRITIMWKNRFREFFEYGRSHAATLTVSAFLEQARQQLDLKLMSKQAILSSSQASSVIRSIDRFIQFANDLAGSEPLPAFLQRLQARQKKVGVQKNAHQRQAQVVLATVASAKGREWKHVTLPKLQRYEGDEERTREDERRFLYVAITRAKESLTLCEPDDKHRAYRDPVFRKGQL